MSKYAKVEDVIERLDYCIHLADTGYFNYSEKMMQRLRDEFADLPTIEVSDADCGIRDCRNCDVAWSSKTCLKRRGYTFDEKGVPHK